MTATDRDDAAASHLLREAMARHEVGATDEALAGYRRALGLRPSLAAALRSLAHGLNLSGRPDLAERAAGRAVACDPADPVAHAFRGYATLGVAGARDAGRWFRRAVALAPAYFEAVSNVAPAIGPDEGPPGTGRWSSRAVAIRAESPEARFNLANARLALGRWAEAWPDHELRLALQRSYPHTLPKPRWNGTAAPGATLLVHDEIGYGDVFNFARYLPLARARVERLVLEVKPGLVPIMQTFPGVDRVYERRSAPLPETDYDLHLPLESLPGVFMTTPDSVPPNHPRPLPPAATLRRWAEVLGVSPRLRVGLVWAGSPDSGLDRARSCRLADLESLASIEDIEWISLQKGPAASQLTRRSFPAPVRDLGIALADFADTAALLLHLDVMVSVDTAVAHLAGALGRRTLALLSRWPAWRWLLDRSDTPWYDSVELFRQRDTGDWSIPVAAVRARLAQLRDRKRTG
ncbi:MAG: hypothetical protein EXQ95_11650 [Alphaproteobacteria bacterium]|nr:hypothetical protein [Alphaproteobacteria bacterium]